MTPQIRHLISKKDRLLEKKWGGGDNRRTGIIPRQTGAKEAPSTGETERRWARYRLYYPGSTGPRPLRLNKGFKAEGEGERRDICGHADLQSPRECRTLIVDQESRGPKCRRPPIRCERLASRRGPWHFRGRAHRSPGSRCHANTRSMAPRFEAVRFLTRARGVRSRLVQFCTLYIL